MIRIVYDREFCTVSISGHAEYAEKGKDIVCAAVSALYCTLRLLKHSYEQVGADDALKMVFSERTDEERIVYDAVAAGLKVLAEQYPKYVSFKVAE